MTSGDSLRFTDEPTPCELAIGTDSGLGRLASGVGAPGTPPTPDEEEDVGCADWRPPPLDGGKKVGSGPSEGLALPDGGKKVGSAPCPGPAGLDEGKNVGSGAALGAERDAPEAGITVGSSLVSGRADRTMVPAFALPCSRSLACGGG